MQALKKTLVHRKLKLNACNKMVLKDVNNTVSVKEGKHASLSRSHLNHVTGVKMTTDSALKKTRIISAHDRNDGCDGHSLWHLDFLCGGEVG
jgi:hypothetical protein